MDLAAHQRILLGLFRNTYQPDVDDDPYVHQVARSRDLAEGRRNIFLWRVYVLERTCPLTVSLLRQRNTLEQFLSKFISETNISPFRETQAPPFLQSLSTHADNLLSSVAQFELALMRVKEGDCTRHVISWSFDPYQVLNGLAKELPLPQDLKRAPFQIIVSRELPGFFQIVAVVRKECDESISQT